MTEPGIRPPPNTWSNSLKPVSYRKSTLSGRLSKVVTTSELIDVFTIFISTVVFQEPQPEHWPAHLEELMPHSVQVYEVFAFGIALNPYGNYLVLV